MIDSTVLQTQVEQFPLFRRGKVRDSYDLCDRLLIIATDRISAFDAVMPTGIPGKGAMLNQLSAFWFERTSEIVGNHYLTTDLSWLEGLLPSETTRYAGRSMIARKAERIDIECVVRGYISGSAWSEYLSDGTIAGIPQPSEILESQQLPVPVFTPAIKNDLGHDQNISIAELRTRVGADLSNSLERLSLALYENAYRYAGARGIIIADTKFEFGFVDGELIVIDEMLTPDSSRFWDGDAYEPGGPQASFDKQYLRDWLTSMGWDRNPPAPELPPEVVQGTRDRYLEAFERLTGQRFEEHGETGIQSENQSERASIS